MDWPSLTGGAPCLLFARTGKTIVLSTNQKDYEHFNQGRVEIGRIEVYGNGKALSVYRQERRKFVNLNELVILQ